MIKDIQLIIMIWRISDNTTQTRQKTDLISHSKINGRIFQRTFLMECFKFEKLQYKKSPVEFSTGLWIFYADDFI